MLGCTLGSPAASQDLTLCDVLAFCHNHRGLSWIRRKTWRGFLQHSANQLFACAAATARGGRQPWRRPLEGS